MDVRRTTPFSASITKALEGSGVENDFARWLNKIAENFGVESLSFFLDANSTKAISGRFFYDVNPGAGAKSNERVGLVKLELDPDLVNKIGDALRNNPSKASEVLFGVAEHIASNPDIQRICDEFQNHEFARENANKQFGNNAGAQNALYNFIVGQAAYMILEAAIRGYDKAFPPEIKKNMQEIHAARGRIATIEALLVHPDNINDKKKQKELVAERTGLQERNKELLSDPRNTFETDKFLKIFRVIVKANDYNHEAMRQTVVVGKRVDAAAWDTAAPMQKSGSAPTTADEKAEAGKRAPLEGKPAPTKLAVEDGTKAKRSHSTKDIISKTSSKDEAVAARSAGAEKQAQAARDARRGAQLANIQAEKARLEAQKKGLASEMPDLDSKSSPKSPRK